MFDTLRYIYIGRTRLNDESGNQLEVVFHGRDRKAPSTAPRGNLKNDRLKNKYHMSPMWKDLFVKVVNHNHSYYETLEYKLPEEMTCLTYQKLYHSPPIELPQNYNRKHN